MLKERMQTRQRKNEFFCHLNTFLEKVEADVDEPNKASIRVLEALGMSRTQREIVNEHPLLYYEIQNWNREESANLPAI